MTINREVADRLRAWIAEWPETPDQAALHRALRFLAQWRSILLANTIVSRHGPEVLGGPFAGMRYVAASAEGALAPRLLGVYEQELVPDLEALIAEAPEAVIDIGCAEGYYAVGLARRLPDATVHAFDIEPAAREACADLARRNGVDGRIIVGGEFQPQDFAAFADRRTLVVVDIEGAEADLLRPDAAPALAHMALVVETHGAAVTDLLAARFAGTHHVRRIDHAGRAFVPPPWLAGLDHLDLMLALWEWRRHPTPWLVMRPLAGWAEARQVSRP